MPSLGPVYQTPSLGAPAGELEGELGFPSDVGELEGSCGSSRQRSGPAVGASERYSTVTVFARLRG
jgi:hypothetical protein